MATNRSSTVTLVANDRTRRAVQQAAEWGPIEADDWTCRSIVTIRLTATYTAPHAEKVMDGFLRESGN